MKMLAITFAFAGFCLTAPVPKKSHDGHGSTMQEEPQEAPIYDQAPAGPNLFSNPTNEMDFFQPPYTNPYIWPFRVSDSDAQRAETSVRPKLQRSPRGFDESEVWEGFWLKIKDWKELVPVRPVIKGADGGEGHDRDNERHGTLERHSVPTPMYHCVRWIPSHIGPICTRAVGASPFRDTPPLELEVPVFLWKHGPSTKANMGDGDASSVFRPTFRWGPVVRSGNRTLAKRQRTDGTSTGSSRGSDADYKEGALRNLDLFCTNLLSVSEKGKFMSPGGLKAEFELCVQTNKEAMERDHSKYKELARLDVDTLPVRPELQMHDGHSKRAAADSPPRAAHAVGHQTPQNVRVAYESKLGGVRGKTPSGRRPRLSPRKFLDTPAL